MSVFVDTNVLVYARDRSEPDKHVRATKWMAALWSTGRGRLGWQVLHEYYVTVTSKLDPPRSPEEAREDVWALVAWRPVAPDQVVVERAWEVQDLFGFSWWDALVVAAALHARCEILLTEDLQDGQDIFGLTVLDPFGTRAGEVLAGLER